MKDIFLYSMQFSFTLRSGGVQFFDFLINTTGHDVISSKNQQNYILHQVINEEKYECERKKSKQTDTKKTKFRESDVIEKGTRKIE